MTASVVNLLIEQGTTFKRKLELKDGLGVAINLTNVTFRGSVRKTANATDVLGSFVFEIAAPASDGVVYMSMPASVTATLPTTGESYAKLTKATYDVEMIDALSQVTRLMNGEITISPEVTK